MSKRKLPIGIQTFRKIREEDCYYVDKTAYIRRLLDEGTHYFLSRPRRFGKSLFLDTLKELFEGNESLFVGLAIHDHWDWSVRHPVLRLDFSSGNFAEPGYLQANLIDQLTAIERRSGVVAESATVPGRFARQLEGLHERTGQRVAVLIRRIRQADFGCAGGAGGRPRQPGLFTRLVFDSEVCRRAYPLHVYHWGEQVFQSQSVFRPQ